VGANYESRRAKNGDQQAEDDDERRVGQVGVPGMGDVRSGTVRMRYYEPVGDLMRRDPARNGESEIEEPREAGLP
jgi:hypothetical protein